MKTINKKAYPGDMTEAQAELSEERRLKGNETIPKKVNQLTRL